MSVSRSGMLMLLQFILGAQSIFAQVGEDCEYSMAISFFRTNSDINKKIHDFFPKITSGKVKFIDFHLSDRIEYLGLSLFYSQLAHLNVSIDTSNANYKEEFYKRYRFESFRSIQLRKINASYVNESKIYLIFSKPIDDYLIVEFRDHDPELDGNRKFGKALQVFLKFDSDGVVSKAFTAGAAYN